MIQQLRYLLAKPDLRKAIEHTINQALADSQQLQPALDTLEGQSLTINIVPPQLTVSVNTVQGQIKLQQAPIHQATLCITGSPIALAKLSLAQDKQSVIEAEDLHIEGATSALYAWQTLFRSLHIDWEYQLAQRVGAMPARLLMLSIHTLKKQAADAIKQAKSNVGHQLVWHDLAVDTHELDAFAEQSHTLRARVERLQKRTNTLEAFN